MYGIFPFSLWLHTRKKIAVFGKRLSLKMVDHRFDLFMCEKLFTSNDFIMQFRSILLLFGVVSIKGNIEDDFESFLGNALFGFARSHLKLVCIPLVVIKLRVSFSVFSLTLDENYTLKIFDLVANWFLDFDCKQNVYWLEISTTVIWRKN